MRPIADITPGQIRGEGQLAFDSLSSWREQGLTDYSLLKGRHYMASADRVTKYDRQPVNLHQQLVRTMVPLLAMNAPLADVTPLRADLEFEATVRKNVHDKDAERLKLHEVYQDATTAALLSGVAFTLNGIKSGGEAYTSQNKRLDMGQEFCKLLNPDDIGLDCMAGTLDSMRLFEHRYPITKAEAMRGIEEGCFGASPEDYEDGQVPSEHIATPEEAAQIIEQCTTLEGDMSHRDRVDDNEETRDTAAERLDETILLWDVVLYRNGEIWVATLPAEPGDGEVFPTTDPDKFLALYRWKGPASGPVNRLTFLRVPFNKMPLALAQMQRDLAEICDMLANKTFRQLMATKTLTIYEGSAERMAMAMKNAPQSAYIRGNPASVTTMQQGGLIPEMMPGTQYFRDEWQNAVGNLALASGTGDTGKTATAFEGLMGRVQAFLDFLRARIEQLATDDLQIRSWFLSQNPVFSRTIQQQIGTGIGALTAQVSVAAPGAPGMEQADYVMQGTHDDFSIKCRSFSMSYTNPVISAQQFKEAIATVVPTIIQLSATGMLNGKAAMSILARKLNEPELEHLLPDPMLQALQQMQAQQSAAIDQDPMGDGANQDYAAAGPTGRKTPGSQKRAMTPGPGQGSPRPMLGAQRPQQGAMV